MGPAASYGELERLVADDAPYGDLTTLALGIDHSPGRMEFCARDAMTIAEAESAATMLEITGCRVNLAARSGTALSPGAMILTAEGSAASLHRGWKVSQTLIEIWSGVATAARAIVDAATRRRARHRRRLHPQERAGDRNPSPSARFAPAERPCTGSACRKRSWCFPSIARSSPSPWRRP